MSNRALVVGATLSWLALAGCARDAGIEAVALEYARAVYAYDHKGVYRLISAADRRAKDEQTYLRERDTPTGFSLEVTRQLASYIEARQVEKTGKGDRAKVTLVLRYPNASAPEITALVYEWDARRLNALPQIEQKQITQKLAELHRAARIPTLDGQEETVELVREAGGWRVFLNWADSRRIRFAAIVPESIPLRVSFIPAELQISPGDRARVTVRVRNVSTREVVGRVGHHWIEPDLVTNSLALIHCPLYFPLRFRPGATEEFSSDYFLLKDAPEDLKELQVTYEFVSVGQEQKAKEKTR